MPASSPSAADHRYERSQWLTSAGELYWATTSRAARVAGASAGRRSAIRTSATLAAVQGGPIDELRGVAVERAALEQLEVEVGGAREDRLYAGAPGDHGEDRQLDPVDQPGGHQRPVERQAAVRAQRHVGLLLEARDDLGGVAALDGRSGPVERLLQRAG